QGLKPRSQDPACQKQMRLTFPQFFASGGRASPGPNPYMASFVNRRAPSRGRRMLLPRRHNRTAVDRLAYGCMGLSDDGVSVLLHQTLIRGSAALARKPRRLWDKRPTPKKLIRTPTPALQNAGLGLTGRPS